MNPRGPAVVIIGAGHAGGAAAAFLRQFGFEGPVTVLGDEPNARRLIAAQAPVQRHKLVDPNISMKDVGT